jgi:hypothetical protein
MSKSSSTTGRKPIQRAGIAIIVGILAFAIVRIMTDSNLQLPAGIGAGILAWLITAPPKDDEKK